MLPTFLGIGVNKAATTWLHDLLARHPQVWMPHRRKEVYFFTDEYARGLEWYENFFPDDAEAASYRAVGEFTPSYFFDAPGACPKRIAQVPSIQKFVLSLRNPVDRVYSAYKHRVRNYNYGGTVEEFLEQHPREVERGFYARHLNNFLRHFERDQFLILIFEELFDDLADTKSKLADFLDVDASLFPEEAGRKKMNRSYVPRFRAAFAWAQKGLRLLRRWEMGSVLQWMHRSGLGPLGKRLLGRQDAGQSMAPMLPKTRERLARRYAGDIRELENLIGRDLSVWKEPLEIA